MLKSARLEEIKATIFSVMMDFHPEAKTLLSSSSPNSAARKRTARKADGALGQRPLAQIPTSVKIFAEESGSRSRLDIVTTDRQGLLVCSHHTYNITIMYVCMRLGSRSRNLEDP